MHTMRCKAIPCVVCTVTLWKPTQIDGLVGAKEVLKTVPEKAAFLLSLHAKDRLRLLGLVSLLSSCLQFVLQSSAMHEDKMRGKPAAVTAFNLEVMHICVDRMSVAFCSHASNMCKASAWRAWLGKTAANRPLGKTRKGYTFDLTSRLEANWAA